MMNRRVAIVLAFMMLLAFPAKAYDFAVRMNSGDSLFFRVSDARRYQVAVVPPNAAGPDYYKGHRRVFGVLVIPSEVTYKGQRYTVTAIEDRAFSGCTGISMVAIPASVTTIGSYAFYGCTGINDPVVIGENVTRVGLSAFYGCTQLPAVVFKARRCEFMGGSMSTAAFGNCRNLKKVTIGDEVTRIPDFAFSGSDALTGSLVFPQTLEYIGNYAFSFCSKVTDSIVIPDGVTTIGDCAFNQCHSISSLTIGAGVKSIGNRAFSKCIGLRTIRLNAGTPPRISLSTFSNLTKSVSFSIPCYSKSLYAADAVWKKMTPINLYGSCTLMVNAYAADSSEATVYGSGEYKYGDSATLVVACKAGYGFVSWSDGNQENPRTVVVHSALSLSAQTHAARTIRLIDTVYQVDTIYKDGYKVVRDTVDVFKILQPIDTNQTAVTFDAAKRLLEWKSPKGDRLLSLMLFDSQGNCVYRTDRTSGKLKMRRFPTGSYFVRFETTRRAINYHFFMNNE